MTAGYLIARKLTAPPAPRRYSLRLLGVSASARTVTVPATASTSMPGEWGMFLSGGGHVRLTGTPAIAAGRATWDLADGELCPAAGDRGSWTGIVEPGPEAARLPVHHHETRTPAGPAPAWYIGAKPGESRERWAVHVHGLGSGRAGTLRGVEAASAAGLPSVVPTYRNTAEGLRTGSGRSHLGATETEDIAAVLEELAAAGARSFVLFGWSMGAQMTLKLAASPEWASRVDALVLDSPVLNWASVLEENLAHSRLPRALARAAIPWFRRPRALGLDLPLDLGAADWVARAGEVTQPVLIHHGAADWSVPLSDAAAFAEAAGQTHLRVTPGGHTTSWNVDPSGWRGRTVEFSMQ